MGQCGEAVDEERPPRASPQSQGTETHFNPVESVTNCVRHYSAHDLPRHVTRIPEEPRAPIGDHKTLSCLSPPPPPIVAPPHMLHAPAPLANPQTARTSHCALILRMRRYALVPEATASFCTFSHKPRMHALSRKTSPPTLILRGTLQGHEPSLALPIPP